MNRDAKGKRHADKDDDHLVALRQANDLRAADNRVGNDESAREPDGQIQMPAEQRGKNNGRRIDRDAGGDAALHQKQKRAEQSRFLIEPLDRDTRKPCKLSAADRSERKSRRQR